MKTDSRVVAVLPAAGMGTRLGLVEGSKEVLPLRTPGGTTTTLERLLQGLEASEVSRAVVVIRTGKWDIPATVAAAARRIEVAYRVLSSSRSVPETVAAALPFVGSADVALAFPDIVYQPPEFFRRLLERFRATGADLVLGLFPTLRADKSDMVELDQRDRVRRLWIKSHRSDLHYAWGAAVWGPAFSELIRTAAQSRVDDELFLGHVVQKAIDGGLAVEAVPFPHGSFIDIGTPDDLERARQVIGE